MTQLTLWLGQWQFFGGLGFVLVCLALEFSLAWVLLWFRLRTGNSLHTGWLDAYRFWARVFTLTQALGFGAGLLVMLQFAALWPGLAERAGDALGPLVACAVVSFFVTRTAALGFMLFGHRRLSTALHTLAVAAVAAGSAVTLFFILALLAWLQTPSGVYLFNTEFMVVDPWRVVLSPFLLPLVALFVAVSLSLSAWLILAIAVSRASRQPRAAANAVAYRTALSMAVAGLLLHGMAAVGVLAHDSQHLPARAAATAGYWNSADPPDLAVVAWPSVSQQANHLLWRLPGAARLMLGQDEDGHWLGLDQYSGMAPPVAATFWSFRAMLLSGLVLWLIVLWLVSQGRKHGFDPVRLPAASWRVLRGASILSLALAVISLAWVFLGTLPYAIGGTVTFSEVISDINLPEVVAGLFLHGASLAGLATGFGLLVRHTVRYGVIPVKRNRRLA